MGRLLYKPPLSAMRNLGKGIKPTFWCTGGSSNLLSRTGQGPSRTLTLSLSPCNRAGSRPPADLELETPGQRGERSCLSGIYSKNPACGWRPGASVLPSCLTGVATWSAAPRK